MNITIKNLFGVMASIAITILLMLLAPFLFIWSANALGANIEHTPLTYLAAVVLMAILRCWK